MTGIAALFVAIAIILTGTFAWKDFNQSAKNIFLGEGVDKHWVSLVDDFKSATNVSTNTLTGWKRGDDSANEVYVSSKPTNLKTDKTGYDPLAATTDYAPVYVRVQLTQTLTVGGVATDKKVGTNISENQYPTYVQWTKNATIKTIDTWVTEGSVQGKYWILDSDGWLYWAEPLAFDTETTHLLDSVKLLVEPDKDLVYTVDVKLEAVSSNLDSTTGTDTDDVEYLGGFSEWAIASTAKILPLFIEAFAFKIDTRLGDASTTYSLQVNADEGNDFAVDWGDGTVDTFTSADTIFENNYNTGGEYTVKIIGTMPKAMSFTNDKKLTSIESGFLQNTASTMEGYFQKCTNLTTIPGNLFAKSTAVTSFRTTFHECSSLTSIPADLFKNNTAVTTFHATFSACSNLTGSIPVGLFDNNPLVTTFRSTFYGTSITSIPTDLFKYNTEVTEFVNTFRNCTGITSALPELWSSSHSSAIHTDTFTGCTDALNYDEALANGWATNVTP